MNIFALSMDVKEAAEYHVDKHIVKMPLETAQMLCTNLNLISIETPYLSVHKNHPCTIWARQSQHNFLWLCDLGEALCAEYTFRYKKTHKCESVIDFCRKYYIYFPPVKMTDFAMAMPDEYKCSNPILAYRKFYNMGKRHLHSWTDRPTPRWIVN